MVAAKWPAPPSSRSSRVTDVTTTYRRFILAAASATRRGSSASTGPGRPSSMLQKRQLRVQVAPRIKKVAVRAEKHSNWLGQLASWHTVWSCPLSIMDRICSYWGPEGSFLLSHEGLPVRMGLDGVMM